MKRAIHRRGQKKVLHHLHWWWALIRHKKLINTKPISIGSALPFRFLGLFFMSGGYKLQKANKSPEFYFIVWKKKKNGEYITVEFVRWIMQTTISIHQIACTFFYSFLMACLYPLRSNSSLLSAVFSLLRLVSLNQHSGQYLLFFFSFSVGEKRLIK
jgi:hypothetical protein